MKSSSGSPLEGKSKPGGGSINCHANNPVNDSGDEAMVLSVEARQWVINETASQHTGQNAI